MPGQDCYDEELEKPSKRCMLGTPDIADLEAGYKVHAMKYDIAASNKRKAVR